MICALYSGGENFRHVSHNASRYLFRITSSPTCSRVATASRSRGRFDFSSGYRFSASSPRTLSVSASDRSTSKRYRSDHLALGHIKEAAPPPCRPFLFRIPPAKKSEWRSGKARGRDARYSARGGVPTHAERAKSGVLLEVGSDFLIQ